MAIFDTDTAANLASKNPRLIPGEVFVESDTGKAKLGPGTWNELGYWSPAPRFRGEAGLSARTGEYWSLPAGRTAAALGAGTMYTHAIWVPTACAIDRIGSEVTIAAASSTITLGVYADDGQGRPTGTPLLDAGTIDGNSATAQEKTVYLALQAGTVYHLAALCAGGTPTLRTYTALTSFLGRAATLATATAVAVRIGYSQAAVVGTALPTIATLALQTTTPVIAVRMA